MKENGNIISEATQIKRRERETFLTQQGLTEKGFQEAVQGKMVKDNLSFVLATYSTFDEFFEKELKISGITLACKKGCSDCCHTLITSTEKEIDEAIGFVNHLPRTTRMPIVKRIMSMSREWRDYYGKNEFQIKVEPFKIFTDWQGKPCPFLGENGSCDIYPVRIVDCRTLTNLKQCAFPEKTSFFADVNAEGPVRYRLLTETWASNSIIENQQKIMNLSKPEQSPVTPILHWLYVKRKEIG
jgi:hypothetical protein